MPTSFEPGAPPPDGFIPLCVPEIRGNEWRYVKECLDTGWVSSVGAYVERFEKDMARYVGTRHAVAAVNGTAALHVSLFVAGVKPDDEVLVSTLTFIAPANAIRYAGAWPVFIDAEPEYWQMDPQRVADFLEKECRLEKGELRNRTTGRRVKAIIPVNILGHPVNMTSILELARKFNLVVIEDATESLGAKYEGHPTGSLADLACFSFNGNKIITTGGGGMIATNDETWARRAKYLTTQAKDDPIEYIHNEIGYNYRLTNMQAAMGCAQLEQLDDYVVKKRHIAKAYIEAFKNVPGITPMREASWAFSNSWLFTVSIDAKQFGMNSRQLLKALAEKKIQSRPLWQPIHLSPAHAGSQPQPCKTAEMLYENCLSLPCSVGLSDASLERVVEVVCEGCDTRNRS
jgi:perosamine synthetase